MEQALLALENLSKYYINGQNVVAGLNKVNIKLYRGEFVAITGESGSGKSTLAHILGGILPYEDGELLINGKPTSHYDSRDWELYRRDNVAFISQNYGILPGATVEDNVVSALRLAGMDKTQAKSEAEAILTQVELLEFRCRRAAKLSSGQKQRLSIARALAKPCPILIADEPTGNLDPQNSEKVIRLLAQAAKDRLVILITHEFEEAKDCATRHISLHDGVITMDAQLGPRNQSNAPLSAKRSIKDLSQYITRLQLKSRPVWCAMVLLFFTLTAFAVFAFLGTFFVALDDTPTRIYETDAFLNGATDRIVAVRKDGAAMTQEDYDTILSVRYVDQLERFGYAADTCYAYRENADYTLNYHLHNYGSKLDPLYMETSSVEIGFSGQFVQTVPLYSGNVDFLRAGRLPENFYEVIYAGSDKMLGQQIRVYLKDFRNWSSTAYILLDVTVVGTTDLGKGLYFHDDVGKMLTLNFLGTETTVMPLYAEIDSKVTYVDYLDVSDKSRASANGDICDPFLTECLPAAGSVQRPMGDSEALISFSSYVKLRYSYLKKGIEWETIPLGEEELEIMGLHDSTLASLVCVSPDRFTAFTEANLAGCGDQVSITIRDYAYTDRVIAALEKLGYYALSPYVRGSTRVDEALSVQRTQTLAICIGALIAVLALQLIVLRALFGMETESYRILSNIGLTYRTASRSILLQILLFTAAGQLLGLGGIGICSAMGISRIVNLTKYLTLGYALILPAVHLAASLLAGRFVTKNLQKHVYPLAARRNDLAMEEEQEGAE